MPQTFPDKKRFITCCLVLLVFIVSAQEHPDHQFNSPERGLSQRIVYDIKQDIEGFTLVATKEGLNREPVVSDSVIEPEVIGLKNSS